MDFGTFFRLRQRQRDRGTNGDEQPFEDIPNDSAQDQHYDDDYHNYNEANFHPSDGFARERNDFYYDEHERGFDSIDWGPSGQRGCEEDEGNSMRTEHGGNRRGFERGRVRGRGSGRRLGYEDDAEYGIETEQEGIGRQFDRRRNRGTVSASGRGIEPGGRGRGNSQGDVRGRGRGQNDQVRGRRGRGWEHGRFKGRGGGRSHRGRGGMVRDNWYEEEFDADLTQTTEPAIFNFPEDNTDDSHGVAFTADSNDSQIKETANSGEKSSDAVAAKSVTPVSEQLLSQESQDDKKQRQESTDSTSKESNNKTNINKAEPDEDKAENVSSEETTTKVSDSPETQLEDPYRTSFYCTYCSVTCTARENFRDHVIGSLHQNNYKAFQRGKPFQIKQRKKGLIEFGRENLGKHSYLEDELRDTKETIIGLSFVMEYQSIAGIRCICTLCGAKFPYLHGKSHIVGYKHRWKCVKENSKSDHAYLRQFDFEKKSKVAAILKPLAADIEKKNGRGTPKIQVFEYKPEENEGEQVTSADDNDESLAEKVHGAFIAFVEEEFKRIKEELEKKAEEKKAMEEFELQNEQCKKGDYEASEPKGRSRHPEEPHGPLHHSGPTGGLLDDPFNRHPPFPPSHLHALRGGPYGPPIPGLHLGPYYRGKPDPFLDPDSLKRMTLDHPYYDRLRADPYYHLDPSKRLKGDRNDSYLDPDPLKRMRRPEPYLNPNPLSRFKKDEPYIDPDPLKRVLPSQKAAIKKPVVIDYGHGTEKKKGSKTKADEWEDDIKDILNESKAPDSLAQLSCIYSSPKKEDSPSPQSKRELPFSKSYIERSSALRRESSSDKKEKNADISKREHAKRRNRSNSPDRKRRPQSPDSMANKIRYKSNYSGKKRRSYSRSPERKRSLSPRRKYKRSPSPQTAKSSFKKKRHSRSPEVGGSTSSSHKYRRSRSPDKLKMSFSKSPDRQRFHTHYKKYHHSQSPKEMELKSTSKLRDTVSKKTNYPLSPKNTSDITNPEMKIELKQPITVIDLTNDEAVIPTERKVTPPRMRMKRASLEKEPVSEPSSSNDVDDEQAELIAELLLKMKNSIVGKDVDPQTALKAILSKDITKVLLATKEKAERDSGERGRSSIERNSEEISGPSMRDRSSLERNRENPSGSSMRDRSSLEKNREDIGRSFMRDRSSHERNREDISGSFMRDRSVLERNREDYGGPGPSKRENSSYPKRPSPPPREKIAFSLFGKSGLSSRSALPTFESEDEDADL